MKRALSVNDIINYEPKSIGFDGKWKEAMGDPELKGCWTIWGASGQGKTRFLLQLTKYLMSKGIRVAYDSLEEGLSATFKRAIIDSGVAAENTKNFLLWDKIQLDGIKERVKVQRSPRVIIVDSVQFLDGVTKTVSKGDTMLKVDGVVHGCTCLEAGVLLDIFTPMREDFVK
jgi:predicted ATP-dependent serine protease